MSNNHRTTPGRAVVVGASMGGLLAARALSDTFDQIVLLERDSFPAEGENRKGVPQGRHIHLLLERGRQAMERLLPGLTEDLTRLGAAHIPDAGLDVRWFYDGAYHQPGPCGIPGLGIRRPLLEAAVRRHVRNVIETCQGDGGFALGSGQHIQDTVPLESYLIMLDEALRG